MLWSIVVWIIAILYFALLSSCNATRLQYVQNTLARFVTDASKYTHITSTLRTLHWLPIRQCIIFKTLVLVYKYLTTGQPKYFAPYLSLYKSAMNTRRSNPKNLFLQVPHYCASIHKSKVNTEHRIASLGTTWNTSNVLMIYALRTGWCALESVDTEIKHFDN